MIHTFDKAKEEPEYLRIIRAKMDIQQEAFDAVDQYGLDPLLIPALLKEVAVDIETEMQNHIEEEGQVIDEE